MKTKFVWAAVFATAVMVLQAQAGGHGNGGGGGSGGHFSGGGGARAGARSSFRGSPFRAGIGQPMYFGQRFSTIGQGQFPAANNSRNTILPTRSSYTVQRRNAVGSAGRVMANGANGANRFARGSNVPGNWRNHVVAQHSAGWHRDWNRSRDHWWHGHHCRFIDGSWVIFDFGFYPWLPYYDYDYYPYAYGSYPYGYAEDYNDSGTYEAESDEDQSAYGSFDNRADSVVVAAQQELARQGYYRERIDGIVGPATRRAVARYQRTHGLVVNGLLTTTTIDALRLREVANH